jgi:hypothetical protein
VLALELAGEVVDKAGVEVLTTKVGVTGGGLDLENTAFDGEERDIESTATEIEDEDILFGFDLLVETVGDGSGGGLVDDTEDIEAGNNTSVFSSLSLRVVEVGWDSDDGAGDRATKVRFGDLFHLRQDHRRYFFRGLREI